MFEGAKLGTVDLLDCALLPKFIAEKANMVAPATAKMTIKRIAIVFLLANTRLSINIPRLDFAQKRLFLLILWLIVALLSSQRPNLTD
jgi:hypothetical protein